MTTDYKVTELFCIIDEFCKYFEAENAGNLLEERFSVKVHFDEIKTIYKERPVKKVNKIIQIEVPPNPYWATIASISQRV